MSLLRTAGLSVRFGTTRAVDAVHLEIAPGALVGLIGPNGAGKTTLIDALTGFVPAGGRIEFAGREISGLPPHERVRAGLGRTWQSVQLFDDLTVAENVQVAAERHSLGSALAGLVRPRAPRGSAQVAHVLGALGLAELADAAPSALTHGQRKLAGVARAIAAGPRLVCLDEPAAGLHGAETAELGRGLRRIADDGCALLLVDHDMGLVMSVCDSIYVMDLGRLVAHGTPRDIRDDRRVVDAYLGAAA